MNLSSWANSLDLLGTLSRLVAQASLVVSLSNSLDSISWVSHFLMSTSYRPDLDHVTFRSEKVFP